MASRGRCVPSPACGGGLGRGKAADATHSAVGTAAHAVDEVAHVAATLRRRLDRCRAYHLERRARASSDGASFRRQTPIGPYIVDFVCHASRTDHRDRWRTAFCIDQIKRATHGATLSLAIARVTAFCDSAITTCLTNRRRRVEDESAAASLRSCPLPIPPPQAGEGDWPSLRRRSGNREQVA